MQHKIIRSGGGINSSVVKSVGIRKGSPSADKISPAGISQLGIHPGDRLTREGGHTGRSSATPIIEGQKPAPVAMGNAKALDVKGGGPGTGRTVLRSGTQMQYGSGGPPLPSGRPWYQDYPNPGEKEGK
jgi:hypothetical protein